jgi:predicted metal-dependent HD superfamily phosphohydrolase
MRDRWLETWRDLGVVPAPFEMLDDLRSRYSAPDRHYHGLHHIEDCLEKFDVCRQEAERPAEIEMAIFFHDAIYDTHAADNELKSAEWARGVLLEQGVADAGGATGVRADPGDRPFPGARKRGRGAALRHRSVDPRQP